MSDTSNPVFGKAIMVINEQIMSLMTEISREESRQKAIAPSTQAAEAHLAALNKEREEVIASLQAEVAKLAEARQQVAAVQAQAAQLRDRAQALFAARTQEAEAEKQKVLDTARNEAEKLRLKPAREIEAMNQTLERLKAERDNLAKEVVAAKNELKAIKNAAREFAGA